MSGNCAIKFPFWFFAHLPKLVWRFCLKLALLMSMSVICCNPLPTHLSVCATAIMNNISIFQILSFFTFFLIEHHSCWREERLDRIFDVKLKSLASTSTNFNLPQNQAKDGVVYLDERRIRYGKSWSLFKVLTSKENCVVLKLSTNNITSLKLKWQVCWGLPFF